MENKYAKWAEIFRWYYQLFAFKIREYINAKRILDVGCGPGIFMEELSKVFQNAEIYGIDINDKFCRMSGSIRGDAKFLPFKDEAFDLITFMYSLHDSGFRSLIEARRCLKKDGVVVIKDLNTEMSQLAKNCLLLTLEWNISREYAESIKLSMRYFPPPKFILNVISDLFSVKYYKEFLFDFEIIAIKR